MYLNEKSICTYMGHIAQVVNDPPPSWPQNYIIWHTMPNSILLKRGFYVTISYMTV